MHLKKSDPPLAGEGFRRSSDHHSRNPNPLLSPEIHGPHKRPSPTATSAATAARRSHTLTSLRPTNTVASATPPRPDLRLLTSAAAAATLRSFLRHLLRPLRVRLLLILSFPSLYLLFSSSVPGRPFFLAFFFALAFSSALLLLAAVYFNLLSLPSLRLLLSRSKSLLPLYHHLPGRRLPVLWSIGKLKSDNRPSSGLWVRVYSNGDTYEGDCRGGKCSGSGVYHYRMSGKYEGDWVDEKYEGYGVETWSRGSRYMGQYRLGLRHGFGVYRFYTGDVYAGEWFNGQSHGYGVHTCEDGSRYVGEFKLGVKHGLGHYHFRNGDTYAGEYFGDKMHGFGVYRFANGHQYEGAWHEGRRQGLGMYTFRNGETQSGHWQNGVLDIFSTQNTLPGSSIAVNHSKVLNTVQEARRAAGKAFDVPWVDDRVNKAVAAANKAAEAARAAAVKAVQNQTSNNGVGIPNLLMQDTLLGIA